MPDGSWCPFWCHLLNQPAAWAPSRSWSRPSPTWCWCWTPRPSCWCWTLWPSWRWSLKINWIKLQWCIVVFPCRWWWIYCAMPTCSWSTFYMFIINLSIMILIMIMILTFKSLQKTRTQCWRLRFGLYSADWWDFDLFILNLYSYLCLRNNANEETTLLL